MVTSPRRATATIAAATVGVYILIMAGATSAVADTLAVCGAWPTCDGRWVVSLSDPRLVIAWSHRLLALAVGVLVVVAAWTGTRATDRRAVRAALTLAVILYPVQIAVGAMTVLGGSALVSGLHLLAGVVIFAALVASLAWTLTDGRPDRENGLSRTTVPDLATAQPESTGPRPGGPDRFLPTLRAYIRLTKPRLMWLLCLVAAASMALTAGGSLTVGTVAMTLLGGVLAIGASGTFNHVLERDVDRRMRRTADRPLATDQVGVGNAVAFGGLLTVASIGVFLSINVLAAVLGAMAIAYYSVIYTLVLKPNTVQNTVIGGLAGSFPALIGAAAATNTIGPAAILLAAVIFLWTPAHFYNLALAYRDDYERGGFPMLPVVAGETTTFRHIVLWLGATLVAAIGLAAVGDLGWVYAVTAVTVGIVFLWAVIRLARAPSTPAALRSFHASNAYLGLLLIAIVVDTLAV